MITANPVSTLFYRDASDKLVILNHKQRLCSGTSHKFPQMKSLAQFAPGDHLCKTCRRRA